MICTFFSFSYSISPLDFSFLFSFCTNFPHINFWLPNSSPSHTETLSTLLYSLLFLNDTFETNVTFYLDVPKTLNIPIHSWVSKGSKHFFVFSHLFQSICSVTKGIIFVLESYLFWMLLIVSKRYPCFFH